MTARHPLACPDAHAADLCDELAAFLFDSRYRAAKGIGDMPRDEALRDVADKHVGKMALFAAGFVVAMMIGGTLA
jgi:hypothetical protein